MSKKPRFVLADCGHFMDTKAPVICWRCGQEMVMLPEDRQAYWEWVMEEGEIAISHEECRQRGLGGSLPLKYFRPVD